MHHSSGRRCFFSFSIALLGFAVLYTGGRILGSAAAQGDAIHLLADGAQSGFLALMVVLSQTKRLARFKTHVLGARAQALFLTAAGVAILFETWHHTETPRSPEVIILLGMFSTAVATLRVKVVHEGWNFKETALLVVRSLTKKQRIDLVIIAELSHVMLDVITSVFVIMSGVWLYFGGTEAIDRLGAYAVASVAFLSATLVWRIADHH